jgi:hypothetical protein
MSYNACIEKIDARKLPSAAQEEKRRQAVALHKKGIIITTNLNFSE